MAFLPFLSPLCLRQLFKKCIWLFVEELCVVHSEATGQLSPAVFNTPHSSKFRCDLALKSLRQPFCWNKPTWFRLLSFQQCGIWSHFPYIIWMTNLSQACTVPKSCSWLCECLNAKPHTIWYGCRHGGFISGWVHAVSNALHCSKLNFWKSIMYFIYHSVYAFTSRTCTIQHDYIFWWSL